MVLSTHIVGDGIPLIVLPGFGLDHEATAAAFEPVFAAAPGWRRTYLDLPGTGDSLLVEATSEAVLDAVIATIRATVGRSRFAVAGFSYGGYLATAMARRQPAGMLGMLLVCAGTKIVPAERNLSGLFASAPEPGWLDHVPPDLREHFEFAVGRQTADAAGRVAAGFARRGAVDDEYLDRLRSTGYQLSDEAGAQSFDGSVTAISGGRDRVAGYLDQLGAMQHYPRGNFALVGDAGHYLPFEQPAWFASIAGAWLDEVAAQVRSGRLEPEPAGLAG